MLTKSVGLVFAGVVLLGFFGQIANAFNYYYITENKRGESELLNGATKDVVSLSTVLLTIIIHLLNYNT